MSLADQFAVKVAQIADRRVKRVMASRGLPITDGTLVALATAFYLTGYQDSEEFKKELDAL